jgi:4-carboxymuconolactone decarboxylase
MDTEQQAVAKEILAFSSNGLGGPFGMLLRSPAATRHIMALSRFLRFETILPDRLAELAILIHARIWTDQYEWSIHALRAARVGVADAAIAAIRDGSRPADLAPDEAALYDYCVELSYSRSVGDEVFARAREQLGERGVVELTVMLAQYVMVSYMLGVSQAELPANAAPALPPLSGPLRM